MQVRSWRSIIILAALCFATSAYATDYTWVGGTDLNWSTANNWQDAQMMHKVPTAADNATIGNFAVNLDVAVSIKNLTLNGANISGPGNLTVTGAFIWNLGSIGGPGKTFLQGTSTITAPPNNTNPNDYISTRDTTNSGTATVVAGTNLIFSDGKSIFTNSGELDVEDGATISIASQGSGMPGTGSEIDNTGTIKKMSGTGTAQLGSGALVINNKAGAFIDAASGTIQLLGSGSTANIINSSIFVTDTSSAAIRVDAAMTMHDGARFNGSGNIYFEGSNVFTLADGNAKAQGPLTFGLDSGGNAGSLIINNNSNFEVAGTTFTWTGGTINITDGTLFGKLNVDAGSQTQMNISGNAIKVLLHVDLVNAGMITWTGTGNIEMGSGARIDTSGTFQIQNDAQLTTNVGGDSTPFFSYAFGTLRKSDGVAGSQSVIGLPGLATGKTFCDKGKLTFSGAVGGRLAGPLQVAAGATAVFSGGTYNVNAIFQGPGLKILSGGTFAIDKGTALDVNGGIFEFDGGTINGFGIPGTPALLELGLGATMNWNGGSAGGHGILAVRSGAMLNIAANNNPFLNGWVLMTDPGGMVNISGSSNFNCGAGSSVVNSGVVAITGDCDLKDTSNGNQPPFIINTQSGLIDKIANPSFTRIFYNITNNGTVTVEGDLRFESVYQDIDSGLLDIGSRVTFQQPTTLNSTVKGTGTLTTVAGTEGAGNLNPGNSPGQLNIVGAYTFGPSNNFIAEIGGTGQGTTYDFLNQSGGTLTLGGTLTVNVINGFAPAANSFTVATSTSALVGTFKNVASGGRVNDQDGSGSFLATYSGNNVVLSSYALPPANFSQWQNAYFTPQQLSDPNISGPLADPAHDGLNNLLDYALNIDPNHPPSSSHEPFSTLDPTYLSLVYTKVLGATDLTYAIEQSTDLLTWSPVTPTNVILSDNSFVQTIKAQVPRTNAGAGGKLFLRLRVTKS